MLRKWITTSFSIMLLDVNMLQQQHKYSKEEMDKINVEVYVNDILVRSKEAKDHWHDLEETFHNLSKVGLKLRAGKCAFGVIEGKFLGYMITREGIKLHLEKSTSDIQYEDSKKCKGSAKTKQRSSNAK